MDAFFPYSKTTYKVIFPSLDGDGFTRPVSARTTLRLWDRLQHTEAHFAPTEGDPTVTAEQTMAEYHLYIARALTVVAEEIREQSPDLGEKVAQAAALLEKLHEPFARPQP